MKRIFFSILCAGIILVGCSKDGGSGSASITGIWQTNKVIATSYLNGSSTGSDTTTSGSLLFGSDGKLTSTDEFGDTSQGIYTYNTSSKLLTLISDGDTTNATVTSLTSNNLHFTSDQTGTLGGITVRVTVDADFKR